MKKLNLSVSFLVFFAVLSLGTGCSKDKEKLAKLEKKTKALEQKLADQEKAATTTATTTTTTTAAVQEAVTSDTEAASLTNAN